MAPALGPRRVSQGGCEHASVERLKHHDVFAAGEHHATEPNEAFVLDRVANDRKCFQSSLAGWSDKIWAIQVTMINFDYRHEAVDLDGVSALNLDLLELVILDTEVRTLSDFIAAADRLLIDDVAGFGINQLLLEPVVGFLVDAVERDTLRTRRRRIERDRARHERQLEVPLPVSTRGHGTLLTQARSLLYLLSLKLKVVQ